MTKSSKAIAGARVVSLRRKGGGATAGLERRIRKGA